MYKINKPLLLLYLISFTTSYSQDASVSFGSAIAPGGALFVDNITSITLVDDTYAAIAGISTIVPGDGPGGVSGYANITETLNNVSFSGTPWLALNSAAGTGYIRGSAFAALASASAPNPIPINNYMLGAADTSSTISVSGDGLNVFITDGAGIFGSGASISVVPEPSTYALIAGFAAFLFVAIRRRK